MEARARILATIGPASDTREKLVQLAGAGLDVARLNLSHGTHDIHRASIASVRAASKDVGRPLAILMDLQGPKIRIGTFATPTVDLTPGSTFTVTTSNVQGTAERVSTSHAGLPGDVKAGDPLLLDDGKIRLVVERVSGTDVVCRVEVGGPLSARKGINLPGSSVSVPSLTGKDLDDLAFGIREGVDALALSFVRSAEDIRALRSAMLRLVPEEGRLPVVAKIEKPQAIDDIDAIIEVADGIMVARGDLGVELPPEEVPAHQKMIIRKCLAAGRPVIVATQMLESMIANPVPTRAETSDVANAVMDGADAVMLSGETSVGKYPVEAVSMMNRIILQVEGRRLAVGNLWETLLAKSDRSHDALGRAACVIAEQTRAAAIIAVTHTGLTARVVARYRPETSVIAVTDMEETLRRLSFVWGVRGVVVGPDDRSVSAIVRIVREKLETEGLLRPGAPVVILGGVPLFSGGSTNSIRVERLG
jgi:pyruvate kinase